MVTVTATATTDSHMEGIFSKASIADAHPLAPLTALEITTTASLLRGLFPDGTDLHFKSITLEEPDKKDVIPYLEAERAGEPASRITRRAFACYYIRRTVRITITRGEC
jgi:Cu2+-containing amine oxidase